MRFSFAFQPIIDIAGGRAIAYEALIRGTGGEPAITVLGQQSGSALLLLDHEARLAAVRLAASLQLQAGLSLNFSPAVLQEIPHSIADTIQAATECGLHPEQLIFEATEGAAIEDPVRFSQWVSTYRSSGVRLAIDDFGAGYAGLNLLAEFQPDIVKIDMGLVRNIDSKGPRQAIVRAVIQACADLGLEVIAEGIESLAEFNWFVHRGVPLFQGFLFGKPGFEQLSAPSLPLRTSGESLLRPG